MLKGHIFKEQKFGNHIAALLFSIFMNKADGVAKNYKNSMQVTYSGHTVTVNSGACLVQGRALEEDSSTTLDTGIETMYCKLVVEVDLDKINTESSFLQGNYNIIKSSSAYPNLTQEDIVGQNTGKYQYELARFKVSGGVVTDFEDKRTYIEDQLQYGAIEILNNKFINYLPLSGGRISGKLTLERGLDIDGDIDAYISTMRIYKIIADGGMEVDLYFKCPAAAHEETSYSGNLYADSTDGYKVHKTMSTSSKRYKKEIQDLINEELNPQKLYDLRVKQFKYKKEHQPNEKDCRYDKTLVGFIAEDVADIYPIAADYRIDKEGNKVVDNWNERYLIPAMLKLIQDQKKHQDEQDNIIANLTERIKGLEEKAGVANE